MHLYLMHIQMLFYLFSILSQRILIHCNILEGETEKRKKERAGGEKGDRVQCQNFAIANRSNSTEILS